MKGKRYEIIKRTEREALEQNPRGINAIGGTAPDGGKELLSKCERFECGSPRSSPVNQNGIQMQQGRMNVFENARQKNSSFKK